MSWSGWKLLKSTEINADNQPSSPNTELKAGMTMRSSGDPGGVFHKHFLHFTVPMCSISQPVSAVKALEVGTQIVRDDLFRNVPHAT